MDTETSTTPTEGTTAPSRRNPNALSDSIAAQKDHSILHSPINLGVKDVRQIVGALKDGTHEVKDVLLNECNIIFECKTCSNLFRCLANLLAHKRFYCKEKKGGIVDFQADTLMREDNILIIEPVGVSDEELYQSDHDGDKGTDSNNKSQPSISGVSLSTPKIFDANKKPPTNKFAGITRNKNFSPKEQMISLQPVASNPNIKLQVIKKRVITTPEVVVEPIKPCAVQLNKMEPDVKLPIKKVVLNKNQSVSKDNALSNRTDCDVKKLTCLKCNFKFSMFRNLYSHMSVVHATKRLHFPCPICSITFLKIQSVKRHLTTSHKKSSQQIDKLKDTIRRKAYYKKVQEPSQAIEPTKPVKKGPKTHWHKCKICQRSFDRKSSQISHEKACLKSKSGETPSKPAKPTLTPGMKKCSQCRRTYSVFQAECICKKTSFVTNIRRPPPPRLITSDPISSSGSSTRPKRITSKRENKDFVDSQSLKWRSANCVESVTSKSSGANKEKNSPNERLDSIGLPPAIERRLLVFMNAKRNSCLKCCRKFSSISNLRRHVATHVGWTRYQCKMCTYRSFDRADVKGHIEKVHTSVPSSKVENMIDQVHRLSTGVNNPKDSANWKPPVTSEPVIRPTKLKSSPASNKSLSNAIKSLTSRVLAPPGLTIKKEMVEDVLDIIGDTSEEIITPDLRDAESIKNEYLSELEFLRQNARMGTTTKPIITTLIRKDFLPNSTYNDEDRLEAMKSPGKIITPRSSTDSPILCSVLKTRDDMDMIKDITTLVTRSGTYQKKKKTDEI